MVAFQVILPPGGLHVVPEGDSGFRIEGPNPKRDGRIDVSQAITQAIANMMENSERTAVKVLQTAQLFVVAVSRGVLTFVLMLMLSAYMLITSEQIFGFVRSLYPPYRRLELDDLIRRMDRGLPAWCAGSSSSAGVNAVLSASASTSSTSSTGRSSTVNRRRDVDRAHLWLDPQHDPGGDRRLADGLHVSLLVLAWVVGIHQIEANLLNPKIMGDSARVHPVLVVFALLAASTWPASSARCSRCRC